MKYLFLIIMSLLMSLAVTPETRADIFRHDNGQLISGTEGITPGPGVQLVSLDLAYAHLIDIDLTGASFESTNLADASFASSTLVGANLAGANLSGAILAGATLTNANLAGAVVPRASFRDTTSRGFVREQLYSTASYEQRSLRGIDLRDNDLSGWDFREQDLSNADLSLSTIANANLSSAIITGASFFGATWRGFTKEQLYSTASYQQHNLDGVILGDNNLIGWDFSGQSMANADLFNTTLTNVDLSFATLTGANLGRAILADADASGSDLSNADLESSEITNTNKSDVNLSNANLAYATLTNSDFTGSNITGAVLTNTTLRGFTKEQMYSTDSYRQRSLQRIDLTQNDLSSWDFRGQNLANAILFGSTLTDADLTDAVVINADLRVIGLTKEQLYSTASYKQHDLHGISLLWQDVSGWDFAGQDLSDADLRYCTLADANFAGTIVTRTVLGEATARGFVSDQLYSTASYERNNLQGIDLSQSNLAGWDFGGQDLERASFGSATLTNASMNGANLRGAALVGSTLTDANLADAIVLGATFAGTTSRGFTREQLYSTASYKQRNLRDINLGNNDLAGWNLNGLDLTGAVFFESTLANTDFTDSIVSGASFGRTTSRGFTKEQLYSTASYAQRSLQGVNLTFNDLGGWDFHGQNLTNASLFDSTFSNTDLSGVDMRGAIITDLSALGVADTTNTIMPNGIVAGLHIASEEVFLVRNYQGRLEPGVPLLPLPITIYEEMSIASGGKVSVILDGDSWESTIAFSSAIPVSLGGTLSLEFAEGVDISAQVGRTFDVFDWTGTNPTGRFHVESSIIWDISHLYTTGEVTLLAVPEPSSTVLAAFGLAVAAGYLRRRWRLR